MLAGAHQEFEYVASQLRDMNGPLSYYRTTKVRFEEERGSYFHISTPCMFHGQLSQNFYF
jgi:hypothetical protein